MRLWLKSVPFDTHPFFGYCPLTDVVRYLCQLGYSEEHARYTIRFLFEAKCCESRDPIEEWAESIREIRGTDKGKYHVTVLANTFQYMDAISVDTPILNDAARAGILDVQAIRDRLLRCRTFVDYLNASVTSVPDSRAQQLWGEAHAAVAQEIAEVYERLNRTD